MLKLPCRSVIVTIVLLVLRMNVSKPVCYLPLTFFRATDLSYLLVPYFVSLFLLTYPDQ